MGGRGISTWILAGALLGMSLLGLAGPGRGSWPTEVSLFPYDVRANSTVEFDLHIVNDKANDAMQLYWAAATFCWNRSYPGIWFKPFRGDFIIIPPSLSADLVQKVMVNRTVPGLCPVVIYINCSGFSTPPTTTNATAWINVLPLPATPPPSPPPLPALEARLAADVRQGQVPLTVAFSAAARGGQSPYAFVWDFGDGGGSLEQNPVHAYRDPGNYNATLEIIDSSGRAATSTLTVSATAAPPSVRAPEQPFYSSPGNVAALALGMAVLALAIGLAAVARRRMSPPAAKGGEARAQPEGDPAPPRGPPLLGSTTGTPQAASPEPPSLNPPGFRRPKPTQAVGAHSTKSLCAKCGAPLLPRAAFCRACGAKID